MTLIKKIFLNIALYVALACLLVFIALCALHNLWAAAPFLLLTFLVIGAYGYVSEHESWNNGFCRECGKPWVQFDVDSQGGRGYHCENRHSTWISWPVDKFKTNPNPQIKENQK